MSCRRFFPVVCALFLSTIIFLGSASAQEQSNPPASSPNPAAASASADSPGAGTPPTPTKRVWTNDDMGGVHRDSSIPNYSGANAKTAKASAKPAAGAKNKDAKWYQDQIAALRAKLPPLDEKISQLQAVLNGDTVQSTRTYGGNKIDDWHVELVELQKQRTDMETKVSALQDEARHNGVPDNQIPQ